MSKFMRGVTAPKEKYVIKFDYKIGEEVVQKLGK